jgi:hypothetical protein
LPRRRRIPATRLAMERATSARRSNFMAPSVRRCDTHHHAPPDCQASVWFGHSTWASGEGGCHAQGRSLELTVGCVRLETETGPRGPVSCVRAPVVPTQPRVPSPPDPP